jgi:hypothetical protein
MGVFVHHPGEGREGAGMRKSKEVDFIDMPVHVQVDYVFKAAFDGLVQGGLAGMREGIRRYLLTLRNQQEERK